MPNSCAIASRCSTPFVEPPVPAIAAIAFSNASRVRISDGRRFERTSSIASRPASAAVSSLPACSAGMPERPRGEMPRKSITIAIVLAVNWPPHAPAPGHATPSSSCTSSSAHRPGRVRTDRLEDVLDRHVAPAEAARRDRAAVEDEARGCRAARAPSRRRGSSCRSRRGRRGRRRGGRAATSSIESAITSREIERGAHALGAHRDAVGDRDRVELDRRAARGADAVLDVRRRARAGSSCTASSRSTWSRRRRAASRDPRR